MRCFAYLCRCPRRILVLWFFLSCLTAYPEVKVSSLYVDDKGYFVLVVQDGSNSQYYWGNKNWDKVYELHTGTYIYDQNPTESIRPEYRSQYGTPKRDEPNVSRSEGRFPILTGKESGEFKFVQADEKEARQVNFGVGPDRDTVGFPIEGTFRIQSCDGKSSHCFETDDNLRREVEKKLNDKKIERVPLPEIREVRHVIEIPKESKSFPGGTLIIDRVLLGSGWSNFRAFVSHGGKLHQLDLKKAHGRAADSSQYVWAGGTKLSFDEGASGGVNISSAFNAHHIDSFFEIEGLGHVFVPSPLEPEALAVLEDDQKKTKLYLDRVKAGEAKLASLGYDTKQTHFPVSLNACDVLLRFR